MNSKTAAFTPGPWQFIWNRGSIRIERIEAVDGSGQGIAVIPSMITRVGWDGPDRGSESEANARLIAAAPALLEALEGVLRIADRKTKEFDAARAAIQKAKGGQ